MSTLFTAFQDIAGWTPSGRIPPVLAEKTLTFVHHTGLQIDAFRSDATWDLFVVCEIHGDQDCTWVIDIPRRSQGPEDFLADLDRAFGPVAQHRLKRLIDIVWNWALTHHDMGPDDTILLHRDRCSVWLYSTEEEFTLPPAMTPLFETTRGIVGFFPGKYQPKHGMTLSTVLMTPPPSIHERLRLMETLLVPEVAGFLASSGSTVTGP